MRTTSLRRWSFGGLAFALLAVAAGTWWFFNRATEEPKYEGHPLSYWAQQFKPDRTAGKYLPFRLSDKSASAVRTIGTNSLPVLLKWMVRPEKGLEGNILTWGNDPRLPAFARRALAPVYPKSYRPDLAVLTFRVLGSDAKDAVPSLVQMLQSPNNSRWAVMALSAVGSEGATALEEAFPTIGDGILRANIINQLEHGTTPTVEKSYALFLGEYLIKDPHAAVRMSIARTLGVFTNSATTAVPALSQALRDKDGGVRMVACSSLEKFGPAASSSIAVLETVLNDENQQTRINAARALNSIQGTK